LTVDRPASDQARFLEAVEMHAVPARVPRKLARDLGDPGRPPNLRQEGEDTCARGLCEWTLFVVAPAHLTHASFV
jgi:hypothetical protein